MNKLRKRQIKKALTRRRRFALNPVFYEVLDSIIPSEIRGGVGKPYYEYECCECIHRGFSTMFGISLGCNLKRSKMCEVCVRIGKQLFDEYFNKFTVMATT